MYPGNVEVIPELQHELRKLQEENRNLRNSGARSTDGEASSRGSRCVHAGLGMARSFCYRG